ncbi:MAG: MFS transporter, partial [Parachlamydia sp.]|nr:MFS transporter [Parachlamydia sp.]
MKNFIGNKFFLSTLDAMFTLLSFIFVKELQASPLQLTLLIAAKPIVGLCSFYGHIFIKNEPKKLKPFIIVLNILGFVPCLFFPLMSSPWFFILSYALFHMAIRATVPAWVELLKINLSQTRQANTFSYGLVIQHMVTIFCPLLISSWLDNTPYIWKWIFFLLGCIQIFNILLLCNIQLSPVSFQEKPCQCFTMTSIVFAPWKNFLSLMRERRDFLSYQMMFFLGGIGLVAMQPALPIFYKETLNLSYVELTFATHFCKGICFAILAHLWARKIHRLNIFKFNFYINICSCIFITFLLFSTFSYIFICLAFAVYGLMQSGCELCWNLSGSIFAKDRDSTLYTSSNLAFIAMRGCLCPFIGYFFMLIGTSAVFVFAGCTCVLASIYAIHLSR